MRQATRLNIKPGYVDEKVAGRLVESCPFNALEYGAGRLTQNASCRLCGLCVRADSDGVLTMSYDGDAETAAVAPPGESPAENFSGVAVFAEVGGGKVAPVSLELLGKAPELARGGPVYVVAAGGLGGAAEELRHYGASAVYVYGAPELAVPETLRYSLCLRDFIARVKPAILLVGATDFGRSLAPRVAAAARTGLTADCTGLSVEDGLLVQTRPAFGGNIMARIITKRHRPQLCTVRYRVFDAPPRRADLSPLVRVEPPAFGAVGVRILRAERQTAAADISEAERIVAVGRGAADTKSLSLCRELADLLSAQLACTRPLAEAGVFPQRRQIGLSGRMVKPKLLVAVGISGAVQFTSAMRSSECIVAVNPDGTAPIFSCAHHGFIGTARDILPELIDGLRAVSTNEI